jgi:hypothetical protein
VYKVFGCIQWRDENLVDTPHPSMKRFALMNSEAVDDDVLQVLDIVLALAGVHPHVCALRLPATLAFWGL